MHKWNQPWEAWRSNGEYAANRRVTKMERSHPESILGDQPIPDLWRWQTSKKKGGVSSVNCSLTSPWPSVACCAEDPASFHTERSHRHPAEEPLKKRLQQGATSRWLWEWCCPTVQLHELYMMWVPCTSNICSAAKTNLLPAAEVQSSRPRHTLVSCCFASNTAAPICWAHRHPSAAWITSAKSTNFFDSDKSLPSSIPLPLHLALLQKHFPLAIWKKIQCMHKLHTVDEQQIHTMR